MYIIIFFGKNEYNIILNMSYFSTSTFLCDLFFWWKAIFYVFTYFHVDWFLSILSSLIFYMIYYTITITGDFQKHTIEKSINHAIISTYKAVTIYTIYGMT